MYNKWANEVLLFPCFHVPGSPEGAHQADFAAFITEIRNVETDVMGTGCWRAGNSWDTLRGSEDESFISWVFFCGLKVINWKTHFFNGYMLQSWFVICWGNETSQQAGAYRRESEGDEISWSHRAESKWIPERKNYTVLSQGWDQLPPTSTRNWGKIIGREKKVKNKEQVSKNYMELLLPESREGFVLVKG